MNIYRHLFDSSSEEEELQEEKPKKVINLWYNENTWVYKLINNKYFFIKDNSSVLKLYDLFYLKNKYITAENNYIKNKLTLQLLQIITKDEWFIIKDMVFEK